MDYPYQGGRERKTISKPANPLNELRQQEGAADEVRAALGASFPKLPLHKIEGIGALVAVRQPAGWQVQALGAPHVGQRTEADLIRSFIDRVRLPAGGPPV